MNIAITAGVQLMPPAFHAGLSAWSSENGLSGEATWAGAANAALVPADQDFGACLEIVKQADITRLRFKGETPILPGTYLRIAARIKAVAGTLPSVRVAAWAGTAARVRVTGLTDTGPATALSGYGKVVEVSAIVATSARSGVDMAWSHEVALAHFGLDLTGGNGGAVRIESLRIDDVTAAFLPGLVDWVDVRDYGARGDGATDDRAAFQRADTASPGGQVLVPEGTYYIGGSLTMESIVRFKGTLKMPRAARLQMKRNFDFPSYAAAFGDETEGFRRGVQALFDYNDLNTFDLCGRKVDLTEPLDVAAAAPNLSQFSTRRVIANGQIAVAGGAAFATRSVASTATYDPARLFELRNVDKVSQIEIGSRVTGPGVGREVYVRGKDVAAGTLTLSLALYGGAGTRSYTFVRDRYAIDFSGVPQIDRLNFSDIDFQLGGEASGVMMPAEGGLWVFRDCFFTKPKSRGISSIGTACQGLRVDQCEFLSNETDVLAQNRASVAININNNDAKIRNNRFVRFGHFCVASGSGHMFSGNHFFQGDGAAAGLRTAGLVLTDRNVQINITGNYIDNCAIEWTNEHQGNTKYVENSQPFGGLTITGNTFLCSNTSSAFSWLVIKPYGSGHFINGLGVIGNVFKALYSTVERVDRVDSTFASMVSSRMRNIRFEGNSFWGVDTPTVNPVTVTWNQATAATKWIVPTAGMLPFEGVAYKVESLVAETAITTGGGARTGEMPSITTQQNNARDAVALSFASPVKGRIAVTVRMDEPN